ncbi:MAG TPA: hypothetical protein VK157_07805 [Phycisphaerales bacterium]|nr:hypothetical protein [Phycisphaerales bacterium]
MKLTAVGVATMVFGLAAGGAAAQVHQGDIILDASAGQIRTGGLASGAFEERRGFVAELGFIAPFFASDPGFDNLPGTFAAGSRIGFTIQDALRKWDGSDFDEVSVERLDIARSTLNAQTPVASSSVTGFTLTVGANGQWHRHYEYTLFAPAPESPRDGVYLLELTLWSNSTGIAESEPFYVLFDQNATTAEVLAAQQYMIDTFISPVAGCDSIDFNNNGVFPEDQDVVDFFAVLAGGECAACSDIDFNNNGVFPEDQDVIDFFTVLAGGECG